MKPEISEEDREHVRKGLTELAEHLRKRYELTAKSTRRFLREMLTVSI